MAPNLTDVIVTPPEVDSYINLDNRKRFRILCDRIIPNNRSGADQDGVFFQKYMRFRRGIKVQFNSGNTGTISDCVTNAMLLVVMSDAISSSTCEMWDIDCRIRYTDV